MMQRMIRSAALLTAMVVAAPAFADNCTALAGKTQCFSFTYSTGGSNFYRVSFQAGGSLTFPDVAGTTGTWSCPGNNFLETNYSFGGFEAQHWLAESVPPARVSADGADRTEA